MGVTANTQCGFCNDEKDSIEHMFWKCACIRRFWTSLETILKEKRETALNVKFTQNLVLFGTEMDIKTYTVFGLVILKLSNLYTNANSTSACQLSPASFNN